VHCAVIEQVSHRQSQGLQSVPLGGLGVLGAPGTGAAPPEQDSWWKVPRSEQAPPPQPTGPKAERTTTVPTRANATALIVGLPRPSHPLRGVCERDTAIGQVLPFGFTAVAMRPSASREGGLSSGGDGESQVSPPSAPPAGTCARWFDRRRYVGRRMVVSAGSMKSGANDGAIACRRWMPYEVRSKGRP
jgi:hypothetical protein